jgi:hypothetical protein
MSNFFFNLKVRKKNTEITLPYCLLTVPLSNRNSSDHSLLVLYVVVLPIPTREYKDRVVRTENLKPR